MAGRFELAGLALATAVLAGAALAQPASAPNAPMDISADNGSFDNAACESTWSGAAEVLQGTTRIRAHTIHAFFKKKAGAAADAKEQAKGLGGATAGMPGGEQSNCGATERIEAEGEVFYVTPDQVARGDRAVYTAAVGVIVLTGNVIVVQGKNVIHGDRLTINVATREAQMESDAREARRILNA